MAYGKIKADSIIYDNSGSDVEKTIASLAAAAPTANPTFTGTVTIPTQAANDNTTKAASTAYVQTELGDYALKASPTFTGTVNAAALTLSGNLVVNGSTTTVSSTTIEVADKNIELGKVSTPTDTTADGGGLTLKGASDKTFNWVDATDAWTSSEHIHLGDNKKLLLGTGSDLQIYHSGSNSHIKDSGTGLLSVNTNQFQLTNAADTEVIINAVENGSVSLYHDNSKKIETTAAGVTVTGTVSDDKGDVRSIPQVSVTSAYDVVPATAGRHIFTTANVKLANNMTAGDAITIVNNHSGDITIDAATNSVTLTNSADAATGNRTLASKGMATVLYVGSSTCFISGAGLS